MSRASTDEVAFRAQIQSFEDEFFNSMTAGEEALQQFSSRWAEFAKSVSTSYSPETMQHLHRVSLTIGILCESLLSLEHAAQEIQRDFEADIVAILDCSRSTNSSKTCSSTVSTKRDVTLAARWLSRNYHNPYPSRSTRDDISKRANWPRKDVDGWFTEARKRIGWSKIRKDFFSNKRADAVRAATMYFSGHSHSLHPALELALVTMAAQAKELHVEPVQCDDAAFPSAIQLSPNSSIGVGYNPIPKSMVSMGLITPPQTISPPPHTSLLDSVPPRTKRRISEDLTPAPECLRPIKRPRHVKSDSFTSTPIQLPSPTISLTGAADYDSIQEPLFTEIGRFPSSLALPAPREELVFDVLDGSHTIKGSCQVTRLRSAATPSLSRSRDATIITSDDGYPVSSLERTSLLLGDTVSLRTSPPTVKVTDVQDLLYPNSATSKNSIASPVVEDMDNTALQILVANSEDPVSGPLDNSLCASPYEIASLICTNPSNLVMDLPQSEQIAMSIPSGPLLDFSEIEVDLNSLLDPSSAFYPSADAFPDDVLENFPTSSAMSKKTSQLVQLDTLRKHQAYIQKQIQSLEFQITTSDYS